MSILIKGMKMPQGNSTINVLIYADGTVYTGHVNDSQYSAVSVPTPHGDLIDRDKLNIHDVSPAYGFCVMGVMEEDIELADTVIEAEGGRHEQSNHTARLGAYDIVDWM